MHILEENDSQAILKFLICLEVFKELELLEYRFIDSYIIKFSLIKGKKVELSSSKLYNKTST